ncbi:serine/threonine-protein kinase [Acrocarpospora catenulata]|uniref:serine/threonine-protein kinase n=1 Tax=Acrocarpospora catenulata TaxID=2836182 RepID=UPI001BDA4F10|nr:protein kinase [Acrocarpospora catenulata]
MDPLQASDPPAIGGFQLLNRLGSGGMGRVYLGVSPAGERVAVKVINDGLLDDPHVRERFAAEVQALKTVFGPRVAALVSAAPAGERPWLAVEYVPGRTLHDHVTRHGPLETRLTAILGASLAEGLATIHAAGLLHRDLKPHNIVLGGDGPTVIDFGLAVLTERKHVLTQTGAIIGTLVCMAPEQVKGERQPTTALDVYALGATLVYAVTGRYPYDADNAAALVYKIISPEIRADLTEVSPGLADLLHRMLAVDPADRPLLPEVTAELVRLATAETTATEARQDLVKATFHAAPPKAVDRSRAVSRWPFVGRRAEVARLEELLTAGACGAVLLDGPSGVGKTRLAEEFLAYARALGHGTAQVAATASASVVPLSALAPILPEGPGLGDPHALFDAVRARVAGQAGAGRFVLAVDDVDLLDPTSLALLGYLLADARLFLIATKRREAEIPDTLDALWRRGDAVRLELGPLDRQGVETLLHLALGGPVTAGAAHAFWTASLGNALYLRELVENARREGTLTEADGVWRLNGGLSLGSGVTGLVAESLRDLDEPAREVVERLALCQPLGLDDLLVTTALPVLTRLENLGVIRLREDGRRQEILLGHPLHAQVLRESIPRLRARALLLAQVAAVEEHGARRQGDPLLLASWRLDATGTADPELLAQAALLALHGHDVGRAERLTRAALRHGPNSRAALLLGESLGEQGRHAEAEEVMAAAFQDAPDDEAEQIALIRATNLFYGLGRAEDAFACLREARERGGPDAEPGVAAIEALLLSATGRAAEALDRIGETPPEGPPRRRVLWLRSRGLALAGSGRVEQAVEVARLAFDEHVRLDDRLAVYHPAGQLITLSGALLEAGEFDEAEQAAREGRRLATVDEAGSLAMWFPWNLGSALLARGRPESAARHFREGLALARAFTHPVAELFQLAGLVLAAAQLGAPGDPDLVRAFEERALIPMDHSDVDRARAWLLVANGDTAAACDLLRDAAAGHRTAGRVTAAVAVLHDLVRLGDPEPLATWELPMEGRYAAARVGHAKALHARDPQVLATVAGRLRALGADLAAAEALVAAAGLENDSRQAARHLLAADDLVAWCEGAQTPGLAGATSFSRAERDVARLAAQGRTAPEIAERLVLPLDSVSRELESVYYKLGLTTREDLAAVLVAERA